MPPSVTNGLPNGIETGHFQGWLYSGGAVGQSGSKRISIMRQNGDYKIYENVLNTGIWAGWKEIATATPPKEYDLSLAEGVTGSAKYFKTQDGIVHITLSAVTKSQWNSGDLISNLPEGFRPSGDLWFCAAVGDGNSVIGTCDIKIQSSGEIIVAGYTVANDGAKRDISSIALFIAVKG